MPCCRSIKAYRRATMPFTTTYIIEEMVKTKALFASLLGAAANLAKKRREQGPCTLRSSTTTIRGTKAPLISRGAFALVFSVRSISRHRISISSNSSSPPLSTNTKPPKLSTPPYGIPGPCRQKKSSQGNCSHVVVSFAFILFIFWEFVSIICLCD